MSEHVRSSAVSMLRLPTVIDRTGLSRSSIYKRISDGTFPRLASLGGPRAVNSRAVGWYSDQIDQWIESLTVKA
jgi:prophage regulatory protein